MKSGGARRTAVVAVLSAVILTGTAVALATALGGGPSVPSFADDVASHIPAEVVAAAITAHLSDAAPIIQALLPSYDLAQNTVGADPDAPFGVAVLARGQGVVVLSYGLARPLGSRASPDSVVNTKHVGDATIYWRDAVLYAMVAWSDRAVVLDARHALAPRPIDTGRSANDADYGMVVELDTLTTEELVALAGTLASDAPGADLRGLPAFQQAVARAPGDSAVVFVALDRLRGVLVGGGGSEALDRSLHPVISDVLDGSGGVAVGLTFELDEAHVALSWPPKKHRIVEASAREELAPQVARLSMSARAGLGVSIDMSALVNGIDSFMALVNGGDWLETQQQLREVLGLDLRQDVLMNLTGDVAGVFEGARFGIPDVVVVAGVRDLDLASRTLWQIVSGIRAAAGDLVSPQVLRVEGVDVHEIRVGSGRGISVAAFDGALWVATRPGALRSVVVGDTHGDEGPFGRCYRSGDAVFGFLRDDAEAHVLGVVQELLGPGEDAHALALAPLNGIRNLCWGIDVGATEDALIPQRDGEVLSRTAMDSVDPDGAPRGPGLGSVIQRIGLGSRPGYGSPEEMAWGIVDALVDGDWEAYRAKLPSDIELTSWCPRCRTLLPDDVARERDDFDNCAKRFAGLNPKIVSVTGGENTGRTKEILRRGIIIASDLHVAIEVGGGLRGFEIDNPLLVDGRLYAIDLRCHLSLPMTPPAPAGR